ncbi:sensor domain-containing diguanylate cyclase [Aquibacillus kalidii]|uniref:sensor domain-containing diguanylate cyclase n=1 Tax=Aquibacillus kalidii TaxID=2762597 RepID=UPI001C996CAA|nr:sensor domain-containing diguanylate cyclase [Aquibacillus kalidii]
MPNYKKIALWVALLFIWPLTIAFIYQTSFPDIEGELLAIISYGLVACIVAFFPFIVSNTPIFFVHGIGFAVFLSYGLFMEVMLTQLAVLIVLAKVKISRSDSYRIPLNLLMFLFVSLAAASVYKWLGGTVGEFHLSTFREVVPLLGYAITVFVTNHLLLYCFRRFLVGSQVKFLNKSVIWEFCTTLVVLPVGFVLFMMYRDFDVAGIYFVSFPFISISIILKLFHSSQQVNDYLQETSEIGHELTGELEVNEVIDLFVQRVTKLLAVDYSYVYEVVDAETLKLSRLYDVEGKIEFPANDKLRKFEAVSGKAWGENRTITYKSQKDWAQFAESYLPVQGESIISVPVQRNNKIVAVITLISKRKGGFEKYQFMILDILVNYLAVALENARNYEETRKRSERDQLTGLYNYRFFDNYIQNYFANIRLTKRHEHISLVLLDLDRFKHINDTYGHQSGNEILQELSNRLKLLMDDKGIVARYGGEEFVVLLPNCTKMESLRIAELIRKEIASNSFVLKQHILDKEDPILVNVTASVGVATYPDNCEDPIDLIRHADRAMYIGAKQQGRNKVAMYDKLIGAQLQAE